jgi:formylglycine-generating enzyme required for sulfatase activity
VFGWTKELLHPVFDVAWAEAQGFCAWVGGRLPTEAEWEYAARGGVQGEIYPFNFDNAREKANFYGLKGNDRYAHTAPVRTFDPNGFRLFDIAGNVWEWTADWSDPTYYQQSPEQDPTGPSSRTERVARGGSFFSDPAKHLRISYREKFPPKGVDGVGFRCVLEDSPDTRMRFAR